jgi:hypothetical protein
MFGLKIESRVEVLVRLFRAFNATKTSVSQTWNTRQCLIASVYMSLSSANLFMCSINGLLWPLELV